MTINFNAKQIIICVITILLVGWTIITQIKCDNLQSELNRERLNNSELVDSLNRVNKQHLQKINEYTLEIDKMKFSIDSLEKKKNQIIYQKDGVIVSKNISAGVKQLKDNLGKWND